MFFKYFLLLAPLGLQVLISIFALCILAGWESSSLKKLMCAAIVFGFLTPSLLGAAVWLVIILFNSYGFGYVNGYGFGYVNGYGSGGYLFIQTLMGFSWWAERLLPMLSLVMLLIYVIQRKKAVSRHAASGVKSDPYVAMGFVPAKSWSTKVDPKLSIDILRKREWAFLFDVMPVVAFNVFSLWILARFEHSNMPEYFELLLGSLCWLATLGLILYIPFKDAIEGVSFGKMISKCRVVGTGDGAPIGFGKSFVRNWLFLIPLMPLVELAVASLRPDRKRLGDLWAGTTVVTGEPDFRNGIEIENKKAESDEAKVVAPHPLDD